MSKIKKYLSDYPHLLNQWDAKNNKGVDPKTITTGNNKQYWWKCANGHQWRARVSNRVRWSGCRFCSGKEATPEKNLATTFPFIAKEWHPTKNGDLTPKDVTYGSGKSVWWICPIGHEYQAKPNSRTSRGSGCGYCAGRKVTSENSLANLRPNLVVEWHPTKNGSKTAQDFTYGSSKKVWWQCKNKHEWTAAICDRSQGHGCPYCSNQTTLPEVRLFTELRCIFTDIEYRHRIKAWEVDIYIPTLNIGLEYDGAYYHEKTPNKDRRKYQALSAELAKLIRVRCAPLKIETENDISVRTDDLTKSDIDKIVSRLYTGKDKELRTIIDAYVTKSSFQNQNAFQEYRSNLPAPIYESSLGYKFPEISDEWHPEKNGALRPRHFTPGSNEKVWWTCSNNHDYQQSIHSRTYRNSGCPYCKGKKVGFGNSLQEVNPDLASEWHKHRNKGLTPYDVTTGSSKNIWWVCSKGHEWKQKVNYRHNQKYGCPFCTHRHLTDENSLLGQYPDIAEEWHPKKNGDLKPNQISAGKKNFKVWWLCEEGHEYEATVGNRTGRGSGCPTCFNLYKRGRRHKLSASQSKNK
jgi:hypothetical protein